MGGPVRLPSSDARAAAPGRARRSGRRALAGSGAIAVACLTLLSACVFDGTWTATPAPVTPVQALTTRLNDVSCVSDDWCMAVGTMGFYPLAQVWDGTSWSVVSAPSLDGEDNTQMYSVECGSPTSCVASVSRTSSAQADIYDGVEAWDGEQWREIADGGEGGYWEVYPSSCTSDGTCVVVDQPGFRTLVWDGDSVTTIPYSTSRPPEDLVALDCVAADRCVAVTTGFLATWDGSTWSDVLPGSESFLTFFFDAPRSVSCVALDDCLVVGTKATGSGAASATWDGSSWTEVALPAGTTYLGTPSCTSAGECLAPASVGGVGRSLAWNGDQWFEAPAPPSGEWAMSCVPLWCMGVGGTGSPSVPTAATYEWTDD